MVDISNIFRRGGRPSGKNLERVAPGILENFARQLGRGGPTRLPDGTVIPGFPRAGASCDDKRDAQDLRDWVPDLNRILIAVSGGSDVFDAFVATTLAGGADWTTSDSVRDILKRDKATVVASVTDRVLIEVMPVLNVMARTSGGEWDPKLSALYTEQFRQLVALVGFKTAGSDGVKIQAEYLSMIEGPLTLDADQAIHYNNNDARLRFDYPSKGKLSDETLTDFACRNDTDLYVTWGAYGHFISEKAAKEAGLID